MNNPTIFDQNLNGSIGAQYSAESVATPTNGVIGTESTVVSVVAPTTDSNVIGITPNTTDKPVKVAKTTKRLSDTERQTILTLSASGVKQDSIAKQLGCSTTTVQNVLKKQTTKYAIKNADKSGTDFANNITMLVAKKTKLESDLQDTTALLNAKELELREYFDNLFKKELAKAKTELVDNTQRELDSINNRINDYRTSLMALLG